MTMTMTPRDGTERIRCPGCSSLVPVHTGPGHWHPAQGGWIRPREPLACPDCATAIGAVCMQWLVTVPERMRQLASWGAVLKVKRGQEPTHEDLDEVERFFAFLQAKDADRQAAG
jgi:hypothetical protein